MATAKTAQLPLPPHYDPNTAANWGYRPNLGSLFTDAATWKKAHGLKPAGSQKTNIQLLLIDVQKDFCFPEGTLYVGGRSGTGAIDDSKRTAEFIYRNLGTIKDVTTTLDTHLLYQIFFPTFWVDREGKPATAFTEIKTDDVRRGAWRPNPVAAGCLVEGNLMWLSKYAEHYCAELEKAGKYTLYLWPFHCILGSDGHALVGTIAEARSFHSFVRGSQSNCEVKGGNPLTENYSVLRPEVLKDHDGIARAQKNAAFIKKLLESDAVIIAGQAASHCVKSSIDDLLDEIMTQDATLARKVYVMTDCMSAVTVPDGKGGFHADFTPQANAAFQRFADAGMNLVKSTDPIESWPGITL